MNRKYAVTILIVDSSSLFQTMLSEIMERYNFATVTCKSGKEALEVIEQQDIDMIFSAYHLDDMNGEELCSMLRSNPKSKNISTILFTSEDNQQLLKQALLAGATDIFNKQDFSQFELYLQRVTDSITRRTNLIGRVLVIEDSPSQLLWMEDLLSCSGLEVDAFSSAEDALVSFQYSDYDLVVTDIVLEGSMSGVSLVREIRRHPSNKGLIPIFAVSAYNDSARRMELYHVGINDYMSKPIIKEELLYRIATLIQNYQTLTELTLEREKLETLALLDSCTGLYNRNAFNQFIPKELANAERNKAPISIAVLDLDHFKNINDEYGHDIGDKVLADVGDWLKKTLRQGDIVFRWGGEEFVILLTNCPPNDATKVLENKRIRFNKQRYAGITITASIGISGVTYVNKTTNTDQLFQEADKALYRAKESGRNKVCCYQEEDCE
mgnify:CR=1 FL=1